ncbi:S41 family peptidase [Chitinophaga vietnamensis]|uniref:S41 family peptidase n=1 Tax=Chitinophaga vietnamensis TaxID=2593957 RepID=UPI0011780E5E|nr:S41 family peptidase [Chitinophaga vietnamensis]
MKKLPCLLLLSFIFLSATAQTDTLQFQKFPLQALQEDFTTMRKALEKTHPGLYRYHSKANIDRTMDSLYATLYADMPFYEWYNTCAWLTAYIGCAHTAAFPPAGFGAYYQQHGKFFPFNTHWIGDSVYISLNCTSDTTVKVFDRLLAIDGRNILDIRERLLSYMPGDGYTKNVKVQKFNLGQFMMQYYWNIGRPDSFRVTYANDKGHVHTITVPAATVAELGKWVTGNPVNQWLLKTYTPRGELNRQKPWRLELVDSLRAAVLTINTFGSVSKMNMGRFLDESMRTLQEKNIRHLVIDVRNNNGGADTLGVLLFTHLIHQPSRYYLRQHTIVDGSTEYMPYIDLEEEEKKQVNEELIPEPDGTFTIKAAMAAGVAQQQPAANAFNGKVYVLMNGASYSTTSEFLAALKANKVATLIGEETPGAYAGGNGGTFLHMPLPHTRVELNIPMVYYDNYTTPPLTPGRGVMPDIAVPDDIRMIRTGKDTQLEFVMRLIKGQ